MPFNDSIWNKIELDSIQKIQEDAETVISNQISYVFERSRFYREKCFSFLNEKPPYTMDSLVSLPFTEKKELLEDQEKYPPYGSNLCVDTNDICRIHRTSGTTGKPLILAYTLQDTEHTHETGARCFWSSGVRPEHAVVHCLNFCMWAGGVSDYLSIEKTGATVIPFGVGNSRELIEIILQLRPQAIHCTPSYLSRLEKILKDDFGLKPEQAGLSLGLFGAEGGLDDQNFRRTIEKKWNMKAMNANYGLSDALSMFGAECIEQNGLHFMGQSVVYPEIIDPENGKSMPFKEGTKGELVLTNLQKKAQPLLRYRTRDIISILGTGLCGCGRRGFRFNVIGRSDDMIDVKGINVFPGSISAVINSRMDLFTGEFQILISRENPVEQMLIEIELLPNIQVKEEIEPEMTREMASKLAVKPELKLVPFGSIPQTEGKSKRIKRAL